jgi:hypothetical protein
MNSIRKVWKYIYKIEASFMLWSSGLLAKYFQYSNFCSLIYNAFCKSEHPVHVTSVVRTTVGWKRSWIEAVTTSSR